MTQAGDEKKWYFQARNGARLGPQNLTKWDVEQGYLTPDTLVWTAGQADWVPARETELNVLFETTELPPPFPQERGEGQPDIPAQPQDQDTIHAPEDLFAGYTGGNSTGSLRTGARASAKPPTALKKMQKVAVITLAVVGGIFLSFGLASVALEATMKSGTGSTSSSARREVEDKIMQHQAGWATACQATFEHYRAYAMSGDLASIRNGDETAIQCAREAAIVANLLDELDPASKCSLPLRNTQADIDAARNAAFAAYSYQQAGANAMLLDLVEQTVQRKNERDAQYNEFCR